MPTPPLYRRGNDLSLAYRHSGTFKQRETGAFTPEPLQSVGRRQDLPMKLIWMLPDLAQN